MYTGIAGKVVLITGASSGLGESTAELLASRGAKLVLDCVAKLAALHRGGLPRYNGPAKP